MTIYVAKHVLQVLHAQFTHCIITLADKHVAAAEAIHAERVDRLQKAPVHDHVTRNTQHTTVPSTTHSPNGAVVTELLGANTTTTTTTHVEPTMGHSLEDARAALRVAASKTHDIDHVVTQQSASHTTPHAN